MKNILIIKLLILLFTIKTALAQPLSIDSIYQHLLITYPSYNNITYNKPSTNYLIPNNWLLQTPNIWGATLEEYGEGLTPVGDNVIDAQFFVPTCHTQSDCRGISTCRTADFTLDNRKLCLTNAYNVLDTMYNTIINATTSVDITTLGRDCFSSGAFTAMLKNAIITLGKKSINSPHLITIRLLYGTYKEVPPEWMKSYLNNIISKLPTNNKLIISITNIRSCTFKSNCGNQEKQHDISLDFSWSHGKIIAVDGNTLITGGENLFGQDYTQAEPVNDANIKIFGPVVHGATTYANILWEYVQHHRDILVNHCYTYKRGNISTKCAKAISLNNEFNINSSLPVQAMFISKLNNGVGIGDDADQSEIARVFALKNATRSIKISQQALFNKGEDDLLANKVLQPINTINGNIIQAIAHAIHNNAVDTYIVTSNLFRFNYSDHVDLQYLYDYILNTIVSDYHVESKIAEQELKQHLHLAYISYNHIINTNARSHNKFWIVDDKVFYFGSHNFYPTSLQQFGIIVDSIEASKILLETYWNPMWEYSAKYNFNSM